MGLPAKEANNHMQDTQFVLSQPLFLTQQMTQGGAIRVSLIPPFARG